MGSEKALLTSDINIIHTHQVLLAVRMPQPNLNLPEEEEKKISISTTIKRHTHKITVSKTKQSKTNRVDTTTTTKNKPIAHRELLELIKSSMHTNFQMCMSFSLFFHSPSFRRRFDLWKIHSWTPAVCVCISVLLWSYASTYVEYTHEYEAWSNNQTALSYIFMVNFRM